MKGIQKDPRFVIGMVAEWRGQPYELTAIRPYQRRDGRDTLILVWNTKCFQCGAPFETATPQRGLKFPTRRCPLHVRK
jgi:hypothetical protein